MHLRLIYLRCYWLNNSDNSEISPIECTPNFFLADICPLQIDSDPSEDASVLLLLPYVLTCKE